MPDTTILIIGTYDTKQAELDFVAEVIRNQGGRVRTMDVSILGDAARPCDHSKHEVAAAAGSSIAQAIAAEDENTAMQIMARGAAALALDLQGRGLFDGVIILGGSMGTDLALDVTSALPLGVPKYIVSTVSFSPMIPTDRLAADVQMILWAGGLYGLNSVCKASLAQAAGAVLGAARAVTKPEGRPLIGMTSLGKTALTYMVALKPALEARGFEVAVFHATGMGGRAFEDLASRGAFACVMDFCTQELTNHLFGSSIASGPDRLTGAGRRGTPQIVAPGCHDLVDLVGWQPIPERFRGHPSHAHNRLITSIVLNADERREAARAHAAQLAQATGPSALILPRGGCGEWDRPGGILHDPEGLSAFLDTLEAECPATTALHATPAHINDAAFADLALSILDRWMAQGLVARPA